MNEFGNETIRNPYSWNTAANVFFLDQPVNVGYSYGKTKIASTKDSARDVYAFLQLFLSEYSEYANNPFHISGESYAGGLPYYSNFVILFTKHPLSLSLQLNRSLFTCHFNRNHSQ